MIGSEWMTTMRVCQDVNSDDGAVKARSGWVNLAVTSWTNDREKECGTKLDRITEIKELVSEITRCDGILD